MKHIFLLLMVTTLMFSSCSRYIKWGWEMRGVSEEGRRETFEQTKSYLEGKKQDLIRYRLQYLEAGTQVEKQAIASTVRMMFADYDNPKLEPELQSFLDSILY